MKYFKERIVVDDFSLQPYELILVYLQEITLSESQNTNKCISMHVVVKLLDLMHILQEYTV